MPSGLILSVLGALSAALGERMAQGDGAAAKNTTAPSAPGAAAGKRIRCVFADGGQRAFDHGLETRHKAGGRRRKRLVTRHWQDRLYTDPFAVKNRRLKRQNEQPAGLHQWFCNAGFPSTGTRP